ncbi:DUF835 domain-containing protein [Thermococcus sp.]|uniref:DUF835 domain-containing protein n=1 Tax=Thermococcus sp. TaxID=35749 RepID=UPI002639BB17|nr:DUF835 domain-containing protein [Thermococcus sp.]
MAVLQQVVMAEGVVVMIADLTAMFLILRIYLKNRRKAALIFSLAWFFDFIAILLSAFGSPTLNELSYISLTLFSAFLLYGAAKFLEEESLKVPRDSIYILIPMPTVFMLYMLGVYAYTKDAVWTTTAAASLGITGMFVITAGMLLRETVDIYKSAARYLYISIVLFGFHLVPAALFGIHEWYAPIGFSMSTTLIVLMVMFMLRLMSSESFMNVKPVEASETPIEPGVMIINTEEYGKIKDKLKDVPVLAFIRDVTDVPKAWRFYFVTTVPFNDKIKETIIPTNLARITEVSYRYLQETSKAGGRGIVLMDCIEYLLVYNPPDSVMKFLAKLRDFVVVNNGTLILVVDNMSLGEKLFAQLHKLVG